MKCIIPINSISMIQNDLDEEVTADGEISPCMPWRSMPVINSPGKFSSK